MRTVVGERMQHHRDILASLDDLVEVADAALATALVRGPSTQTGSPPLRR